MGKGAIKEALEAHWLAVWEVAGIGSSLATAAMAVIPTVQTSECGFVRKVWI